MKKFAFCLPLVCIALLSPIFGPADFTPIETFSGRVTSVTDGDTLRVGRGAEIVTIRIEGIDCPEMSQDFGIQAKQYLYSLVFGRDVLVRVKEPDGSGRLVARVVVDGLDTSVALVAAGLAWHFKRYSNDAKLDRLEIAAREAGVGLWSSPSPVAPWEWKRGVRTGEPIRARTESTQESRVASAPADPYRGNVRSRVFHGPGCQHYTCQNCTRIFRTVEEARHAGFRAHADCVR